VAHSAWQFCGAPPSTAGKTAYADVSLGHGNGLVGLLFIAAAEGSPPAISLSNIASPPVLFLDFHLLSLHFAYGGGGFVAFPS